MTEYANNTPDHQNPEDDQNYKYSIGCFFWFLMMIISVLMPFFILFFLNMFDLCLEYNGVNYFIISSIAGIIIIGIFLYYKTDSKKLKVKKDEDSNSFEGNKRED